MDDLGDQIAYLALAEGTPVYSSDEQSVGEVAQILSDDGKDIFNGLIITGGDHGRYVMADRITAIYERGVLLGFDAAAVEELGPPPGV